MARIIKPPQPIHLLSTDRSLFLAGSIEMGVAEDWQATVEAAFTTDDIVILNPRRDDWDASWEQRIENKQFRGQVEWELQGQEQADVIAMYFAPTTKAPITLLELGLFAHTDTLIVCCPDGFWRKGNVDVVCQRYQVQQVDTLADLILQVRQILV